MVSEKHIRVLAWVNGVFAILLFCFLFSMVAAGRALSRAKANYTITVTQFRDAVSFGVSNYLASVVSVDVSDSSGSSVSRPVVVYDPDVGFGSTFEGRNYVIIGYDKYFTGDYCNHGEIVSVLPDRFFCRDFNGKVCIVRRGSRQSSSPASDGVKTTSEAGDEDGDKTENKKGLFGRVF